MRLISGSAHATLTAGVSLFGLLAAPALAQTAASGAAAADTGIADIVVTAQRSAQNLQSVPIAVTALTGTALEERQITNTTKLIQTIPNSTFTKGNFTGSNLTIRGIGNTAVATSGDTGVGVHFNDMPLVAPALFETEFYDTQRIEILRGPQGTLFGRNATAGVLNLITNKASTKSIAAFGEFEYGNYNSIKATGMFNLPLGDKVAVRVAGLYVKRDGFTENLYNNTKIDGRDSYSIRGTLHLAPSDALTIDVTGQYFKENSSRLRSQKQKCVTDPTGVLGCSPAGLGNQADNTSATAGSILVSEEFLRLAGFGPLAKPLSFGSIYGPGSLANSIVPADPRQIYTQYNPTYKADELIVMANADYRFEKATLSLIGGYSRNSVDSRQDYSMSLNDVAPTFPTNIATLNAFFPGKASQIFNSAGQLCISQGDRTFVGYIGGKYNNCSNRQQQYDISAGTSHQWSAEVHVTTQLDGPFNFLLGANYLRFQGDSDYFVMASGLDYASFILTGPAKAGLGSPFFDNLVTKYTLTAYAGFGEAYWQMTPELKLTLGARYTRDKKDQQDVQPQPLLTLGPLPFGTQDAFGLLKYRQANISQSAGTGRALLQWTPTLSWTDDTMIYASYSRGYKSGGINPGFNPAVVPDAKTYFGAEHVNAFEIGWKNRALNGTLQANLTGFYYDYKGLQISRIIARSSFNDNTDAQIYGVEAEVVIQPVEAFQFNTSISYLKTKIKDLQIPDSRDPSGGRSDTVIIKEISTDGAGANCVVQPNAAGNLAGSRQLVDIVNGGINTALGVGLRPAIPVPGTSSYGAFGICSQLASTIANPPAGLSALFGTAPGTPLPFKYLKSPNGTLSLPSGVDQDLSGNNLQNSPEWKFNVGAQYNFHFGNDMGGFVRADLNYTGNFYGRIQNSFADRIQGYAVINLQAQINGANDRWYVRGFVSNLTNNAAVTGLYVTDASSGLFTNIFTLDPRRFGAAIGVRY